MKWSLKLGTFAGIGVYLHWTFALLIGWIFFAYLGSGQSLGQSLVGVGFILVSFACVVLHEFGHALTAKRYGVQTRDITLLPIGGVARLERIPEQPMQELWVALAGPAVNVVIALGLFVVLLSLGQLNQLLTTGWFQGHFLVDLTRVNLLLVGFNMLPAFPMDGGRVLRALLATRLNRARATHIAANVGQAMAILFGILGFVSNPLLIFIAIFVYLGAQAEAAQVETQSALEGLSVRHAMMTRFRMLAADEPVSKAVEELLAGSQQDFPVVAEGEEVVGMLRRKDLVKALADGLRDVPVSQVMCGDCSGVNDTDPLANTIETMRQSDCASLPVLNQGRIVGLLTLENISEVMMVKAAVAQAHTRH